jgi:glycosyltransferase involved in cell wall biosynthesis
MPVLLDVTDLVEFLQRRESVSGVQRVIAETAPRMLDADPGTTPVLLDRSRGELVALSPSEVDALIRTGAGARTTNPDRESLAASACSAIARARTADPISIGVDTIVVFLGAVWINDALMLAARRAHTAGARCVYLLYDLTPVLQTGHTAAVNRLFERYLALVAGTGSAVPAISASSRRDFEEYCAGHDWDPPPGRVTGLPCGLEPGMHDTSRRPWPRPYALLVGTIESRKNHILALRAWRRLLDVHDPDDVPDLVCVGRLGWHADEFLDEYVRTQGLDGKVSVLSSGVSDPELAALYAHAEFTVYPSRYEGWGLPVSESLAFGKVAVVADNSSLREAGGDVALYFVSDDVDDLVRVLEAKTLNPAARLAQEARVAGDTRPVITWDHVAHVIMDEVREVAAREGRTPVFPQIELGHEYLLSMPTVSPDSGYADQYLAHLQAEGLTPMLRQPRGDQDFLVADEVVVGAVGSPQAWGYELRPGRSVDFRFARPVDGPLVVLVATRSMPGLARIVAAGPGGPVSETVYLGSAITLPVGDGRAGEPAQVTLTVTDAQDSVEGFLGIRSLVVLRADDMQAQVIAHRSVAEALRQELDFMQGTRSWKVTAPLRKWKGRGA